MQQATNRKSVTIAMMVATFLAAIEVTVVSTAMPTIVGDLGGIKLISWVYAAYLLTTTVSTPIYGKLTDLFGRKIIFTIGAILFLIGSGLSGMAHTMEQLIWFRAFQGLGAGAVLPITFTIIGDIYTYEERAKIQGLFSGIWGISGILGPLVGGFFVDVISWRWIFYFNVPFGLISLILIWTFLHENFEKKQKKIDYWGAITFTISATALLFALLSGGTDYAWDSPTILGLFAVALVALIVFLMIETKAPEPMLPLSLFKIRVISVSNLGSFLISVVLIGVTAYMPMWIQGVMGYSATNSGLTLTPMSIAWTVGAIIGGRLMLKIGSRSVSLIGMVLILFASIWLGLVGESNPYAVFMVIMLITGFGFGFTMTAFTVVVQSAVGWNLRGAATASNSFVRSLGQMLGVVVLGTVFNNSLATFAQQNTQNGRFSVQDMNNMLNPEAVKRIPAQLLSTMRHGLSNGLHSVYMLLGVVAVIGLIVTFFLPRHEVKAQEAATSK